MNKQWICFPMGSSSLSSSYYTYLLYHIWEVNSLIVCCWMSLTELNYQQYIGVNQQWIPSCVIIYTMNLSHYWYEMRQIKSYSISLKGCCTKEWHEWMLNRKWHCDITQQDRDANGEFQDFILTYIYTHTYIHTHIHTYIHTYIHITSICRRCRRWWSLSKSTLVLGLRYVLFMRLTDFVSYSVRLCH